VAKERTAAEEWLLTDFLPPKQPPCRPSALVCEFICEARKNAEHLMTDIFICYDVNHDKAIRDSVVQSISRYAKTTWRHDYDIRKGDNYERSIKQGIENADNFFYFISPHAVVSEFCQKELDHALKYNKRIVPLLIAPTPEADIPEVLRGLQYVDFTDNTCQADYDSDIDDILNILRHEHEYYKQHKVLLARALKWQIENHKPSFLLRGHNLDNAKTWLRLNDKRERHPPLVLHQELITTSEAAKGQLGTEVFISYSRKDADFARHMNTSLQEAGKTTWFDQESISTGVDFEKEIFKGIDGADNFVFVLSPDAVQSEYCEREVNYAREQNKRFISVLYRETEPTAIPEALRVINWIDFKESAFDKSFPELIQAIELDRVHAHQHTVLQQRASDWAENDRSADFLLNLSACANAETWQDTAQKADKQPAPTQLQQDFIQDSRAAIVAAEAAATKRRKITFTAIASGMVMALLLAILAIFQMNTANKQLQVAKARLYNAKARELQQSDPQLALRLAEKARTFDPIDETIGQTLRDIFSTKEDYHPISLVHDSEINFAAFSPDEQRIVTFSNDNTAKVWDKKGNLLTTAHLAVDEGSIDSIAISPDGKRIATISGDKSTAKIWDDLGNPLTTLDHEGAVNSAVFSSDGQRIVTASDDKTTKVWDKEGQLLIALAHGNYVDYAAFSPDGQRIVAISDDKTAKVLNKEGQLLNTLNHSLPIHSSTFWPNGRIVTTSFNTETIWDDSGKLLATLLVPDNSNVVKVLDKAGQLLASLGHKAVVNSATFSPDGQRIVTTSDKTAQVWDKSGKLLASLAHKDSVHSATFSPSGKWIVTTSGKTTQVWLNYFVEDYLKNDKLQKLTLTQQLFAEVITLDEIGAQVGQLSKDEVFGEIDKFYQAQVSNATLVDNKKRYLQQLAVLIPVSSKNMGEMKYQIINFEQTASENTHQTKPEEPSESQESTLVSMETFFFVTFLALLFVMVIGQLKVFFHRGQDLRGVVYGLITVIVLGSWLVCYDNVYLLSPLLDQKIAGRIGKGLPSVGLIIFSVMLLIVATFFLFYARQRFFQQQVLRTLLLAFSLSMLVLPIGYLVFNYDIFHILPKMDEGGLIVYGLILGSAILIFLPIPLTAYALRPNQQNWWRWPASVLKTISMLLAYVLLLLVTGLLLAFLDGGLAFNAIPSWLRWLLLLVAGILLGQMIHAQFSVYRQQHKWFSLACFSLVYGLIFFGLVWVLLGKGIWIDKTFENIRRVIPYYEMAEVLTLLGSLIAFGFAIVNGRKTYQTQHYILSGVYWLASLFFIMSIAIYIRSYGAMLPFFVVVLGSLLLLIHGIGNWLDRRGWIARGIFGAVILAIVALAIVIINWAEKTSLEAEQRPEIKQQHDELSQRIMLTKKQARKMGQRFVNENEIFRDRLQDGSEGPKMIWLPAGTFRMGYIQGGGDADEKPVHEVSVARFAMGRYEVTFEEYDRFADATGREKPNDRGWGRGNRPVINVSWNDATAYMEWLSLQTGKKYRLPTEAEWEYAARAGTETKYWWGNKIGQNWANCDGCGSQWDNKQTAPIGSFNPNPFGLYDTSGNVWEWTCSEYEESYSGKEKSCSSKEGLFVLRGGSWGGVAGGARSTGRVRFSRTFRGAFYGFRPVRIL
jgi:formylglycine-generating enzyme required for sulfatase activity/WD40 repeat protein